MHGYVWLCILYLCSKFHLRKFTCKTTINVWQLVAWQAAYIFVLPVIILTSGQLFITFLHMFHLGHPARDMKGFNHASLGPVTSLLHWQTVAQACEILFLSDFFKQNRANFLVNCWSI